jgi:hypothetical protein
MTALKCDLHVYWLLIYDVVVATPKPGKKEEDIDFFVPSSSTTTSFFTEETDWFFAPPDHSKPDTEDILDTFLFNADVITKLRKA